MKIILVGCKPRSELHLSEQFKTVNKDVQITMLMTETQTVSFLGCGIVQFE